MQEQLNLERAKREQLEKMLQQERAKRERLLEEERRSRLEFEKSMMAKFNQQMAKLSQQTGSQQKQVLKKRTDKENTNPNLQNALLESSSPSRNLEGRPTVISSNQLIQNSRMYKAMDQKK